MLAGWGSIEEAVAAGSRDRRSRAEAGWRAGDRTSRRCRGQGGGHEYGDDGRCSICCC